MAVPPGTGNVWAGQPMSDLERRWIIQLPVTARDLSRARTLAQFALKALAFMTTLDPGATTVFPEDHPETHFLVICDRLLGKTGRCVRRAGHQEPCRTRITSEAPGSYPQE